MLARSRRPGLLTYRSPLIELAYRLLRLPLYLVNWHTESEHIEVSMMEGVTFDQGYRNIPSSLRLELRAKHPLEVYRAVVRISAKLEGLRWLMYRHWISSAAIGILMFWGVEMGVVVCTWALFTLLFGRAAQDTDEQEQEKQSTKTTGKQTSAQPNTAIKQEPPEDAEPETPHSDTPRTFPTLPSQQPLSYTHPKSELPDPPNLHDIPPAPEDAEADDEDDDFVLGEPPGPRAGEGAGFTDSGIGTSLESAVERGLARRRSGRLREEGKRG